MDYPNYTLTSIYGKGNQGHTPSFETELKNAPAFLKNKKIDLTLTKNNYLILVEDASGSFDFPVNILNLIPPLYFVFGTNDKNVSYEIYDLNTFKKVKTGHKRVRNSFWSPSEKHTKVFIEAINSTDPNEDIFKGIGEKPWWQVW